MRNENLTSKDDQNPLQNLDQWEEDLLNRYPDPKTINGAKNEEQFRDYESTEKDGVKEFYRLNHLYQTYDFVKQKKADYLQFNKEEMPIWNAFDFLNKLVDDSDPDTDLDQMQHLLQTSEAIRKDGHPDWMVLVGLIHDMGKVLCLFGEPQWAVVGDTFPVGCAYSDKIVYSEFFSQNPDFNNPEYQTKLGVYTQNCGLDEVDMSWGHDEYVYHMMKPYLPEAGLYMLRYHSFYAQHRENAYDHLMNEKDHEMFKSVKIFNAYDLYSKDPNQKSWEELQPYYQELVGKYLPANIKF